MKKILYILLAAALVVPCVLSAQEQDVSKRKKVAVVLSGGGAKGVAHIGALRVIEEAGIPIDMIVGTSMGSIIGGLYCIGYTPDQLDSMVMSQDWGLLLSDRTERRYQTFSQKETHAKYLVSLQFGKKMEGFGGLIKGTNLEMLFNDLMVGYHDPINFGDLPIPFACVAADIVDGRPVVFHEGVLPVAMRASMAIPGVFTPVYTDDMVLVDGGMLNNFPTNVAMEMGADIIIGVDVQSELKNKDELTGTATILGQIVDLVMQQHTYHRNRSLTDVYMKVDVEGFSSASFNHPALDSLIRRGHEAAMTQWDDLLDLKAKIGVTDDFIPQEHGPYLSLNERGDFHVYDISFDELSSRERNWVMRKCRIKQDTDMNVASLSHCMSILSATSSYSNIYYSLSDTLNGYNLRFHMEEKRDNSLNIGVNLDSEEIASALINRTFRFGDKVPMEASLTGRLGRRIMAQVDYSFLTSPLSYFNFNYMFNHNDINIYDNGSKYFNTTYNHHFASLSFNDMNFLRQNLKLGVGLRYEYFSFRNLLFDHEGDPLMLESEGLVSYYARVEYESLNHPYFAQRGSAFSLGYDAYTDNFVQYKNHAPFSAISYSWMTAIPLTKRFSLIPSLYGRILLGKDIPFPMLNMIGGKFFGRYLPQQVPFDGVGYMEAAPHIFLSAKLQGSQRIGARHYILGSFNYALTNNEFSSLLSQGNNYFGASLGYGYDFRLFPIMASFNWSNRTKRLGFYIQAGYMF